MNYQRQKIVLFSSILLLFFGSCSESIEEDVVLKENQESLQIKELNATSNDFLDYGLYWFDSNNNSRKGFNENTNTPINVANNFYNASKPTIIYFHGWSQGSSTDNYRREDFRLINSSLNTNINTISAWKQKGWNVAIFYWNQFADEIEVKDAEAKIWSPNGPRQMRYRLSNGSYSTLRSPQQSLSELAYNQIRKTLATNTSRNIRLAGHSLGNQLAVHTSFLISEAINNGNLSSSLMPNRIELLDPFWSKGAKSYLSDFNRDGKNDWTGERVRWYIEAMKNRNKIAVTWYKSSAILNFGIGDGNNDLKRRVAFQSVRLWYLNALNIGDKHVYVRHNYFWSMGFDAPKEVKIGWFNRRRPTGNIAASAATPNSRIRSLMDSGYLWDQVEGRYTITPNDDQFQIKRW